MKRLMIVAEHQLVAHRIRQALREAAGFELIGCADSRRPVAEVLLAQLPDVVVIDEMSDRPQALARLAEVGAAVPAATVVLLTADMDRDGVCEAFAAGATTVIARTVQPASFVTLLRETTSGTIVHQTPAASRAPEAAASLTERELEVLGYVALGFTNARIARELWVTEQTVKFHLSNTYRKLGVANRTQASMYAHLNNLLAPAERLAS
jgi:DNA-binding NarL/FixJ family response regulator